MFDKTYSMRIIDHIGQKRMNGEFSSPRLFLMFYYVCKESLREGEYIEAFSNGRPLTVWVRPPYVDVVLDRMASITP